MIIHEPMLDKQLTSSAVLERICIRPPYFALSDIILQEAGLGATAQAETSTGYEVAPMSAAEFGRHASIAGSCCAAGAQADSRRRYYLAQQAEVSFYAHEAPFGTRIRFRSRLLERDKRRARTWIEADIDGRLVGTCDVVFTILTSETFQRLFGWRRQETFNTPNPYTRLLDGQLTRGANRISMVIPRLPASACAGHFDDFPALPVATLTGYMGDLAGRILTDSPVPYRVVRASLEARDLSWAGERVEFNVERVQVEGARHAFNCMVSSEERNIATMMLVLEAMV
jgi:predicted thioesterase